MEYLRQFCFSPLESCQKPITMEKQVKVLVTELVVEAPNVDRREVASPALDLNINAKCCILRILLNHNSELVVKELNDWLIQLDRIHLNDITTVIIKCFEDKILLDSLPYANDRMVMLKRWEKNLGAAWRKLLNIDSLSKVEILQSVAEIRLVIIGVASCIEDIFKRKDMDFEITAKADDFVTCVVKVITSEDAKPTLQEFIVKVACRLYGTDWFNQMKDNFELQDLVPNSLLEVSDANKIDRWPLLGKSYTDAKSFLYQSPATDVPKLINTILQPGTPTERLGKILSLFTWSHNKAEEIQNALLDCLQGNADSRTYFFTFIIQLRSHFLPALKNVKNVTDQQFYNLYQLITLVIAMVTGRNHMMDEFIHILTRPSVVVSMFLPAMPEHPYFSTPAEYRQQGYNTCPNGHIYTIGECTWPTVLAKCADCGATIGGTNHQEAAGNARHQPMNDNTQAGYLLNKIQRNVSDPADRVSKQGAAVLHFLLHACMLSGLEHEEATILGMLGLSNKPAAQKYLVETMLLNLQSMSDALARNMDDTILVLYKIIIKLLNQRQGQQPPDWSTLEKRREWEAMFRNEYLLPIFQNLDKVIMEAQNQINAAEDQFSMVLYRVVHEADDYKEDDDKDDKEEPTTNDFAWNDPMLWRTIEHSTSAHLLQYLGDATEVQDGVLKVLLHSHDLYLVKNLEPVLQLQNALIQKYQNEVDMNETESIEIQEFLRDGGHSYQEQVEKYISVWNQVFGKLKAKFNFEKRIKEFFESISMKSPIAMFLPSTRGRGQCAKLLAEHLIELQNDFLTHCNIVMKLDESIEEVEVPQLFHSHFVCVDKQEDLLPLIHTHTKYNIITDDQGRHHRFSYNIDALEKQTREQFVMYKKLIAKKTLPCIQYPQDIGIGSDWDMVLTNAPQVQLSAKVAQDVDRIVSRVPSADVCEGVRTLTQAISFLAKVKSAGKRYLYDFLEKDLLLSASRTSVIPKSVQIEHTLSLYNRLSWHKAVHFSHSGLNPYKDALSTVKQTPISDSEVLNELEEVFEHSDVVLLQQRLNEILIKNPDFDANWSLTDIFPDFVFIGDDEDDSWYAKLPDEVLFKHVAHLFSLAVQFTNRQTI